MSRLTLIGGGSGSSDDPPYADRIATTTPRSTEQVLESFHTGVRHLWQTVAWFSDNTPEARRGLRLNLEHLARLVAELEDSAGDGA